MDVMGRNCISDVLAVGAPVLDTTNMSACRSIKLLTIARGQFVLAPFENSISNIFRYCSSSKSSKNYSCSIRALTPSYLVNLGIMVLNCSSVLT